MQEFESLSKSKWRWWWCWWMGTDKGEGGWAAINHAIDESSKCGDTCQVSFDFSTAIKDRKPLGFDMQIGYKSKQKFLPCPLHYLFLSFSLLLPSLCALCKWVAFSSCGLHFYYLSKNDKIYGSLAIFLTPKTSAEKKRMDRRIQRKEKKKKKRSPKAHKSCRRSPAPTSAPNLMLDKANPKKGIKSNAMHKSHKNEISQTQDELQQWLAANLGSLYIK